MLRAMTAAIDMAKGDNNKGLILVVGTQLTARLMHIDTSRCERGSVHSKGCIKGAVTVMTSSKTHKVSEARLHEPRVGAQVGVVVVEPLRDPVADCHRHLLAETLLLWRRNHLQHQNGNRNNILNTVDSMTCFVHCGSKLPVFLTVFRSFYLHLLKYEF